MRPRLLAFLCACVTTLAGCSTRPALPRTDIDEPPPDFSVAAVVYAPADQQPATLPRVERPARYILEPGGVLRVSVGAGSTLATHPPITRRLSARQVRELWREVRDSGLLDPGSPLLASPGQDAIARGEFSIAVVEVSAGQWRGTSRFLLGQDDPALNAAEAVVDRLAELAWIR